MTQKQLKELRQLLETAKDSVETALDNVDALLEEREDVSDEVPKGGKTAKTAPAKEAKAEKKATASGSDYSNMSYNDMKKLAKERGIENPNVDKPTLIAFLEDTDGEDEPKAPAKGKAKADKKPAPKAKEPTTEDRLEDLSDEDLKTILEEEGQPTKGKRSALIARIVTLVEDGELDLDDYLDDSADEEEEEEEETKPAKSKKETKGKKAKVEEPDEDEEDELVYDDEGNIVFEDDENELLNKYTPARWEAFLDSCDDIDEKHGKGKLKIPAIKKELAEFFTEEELGDVSDYSDEEILGLYKTMQSLLTDDEGVLHDTEEPYTINEIDVCCGHALVEIKGMYNCQICGEKYEAE